MILSSLGELARREGLLSNPDYEPRPVAWVISVGERGQFVNLIPTASEDADAKRQTAKIFQIPRRRGRTSSAVADFLVDKSEYVLGIEPEGKRSKDDLRARSELFRQSIRAALQKTECPALSSLVTFLESDAERGLAAARLTTEGYKSNDLIAFEFHGKLVHELPVVQQYFSHARRTASEDTSQCLMCGSRTGLVDKHPTVKVPGGSTSGVALVSFNTDAFESFGLLRNENAPVCRDCADAYTTALNRLLSDRYPDPRHDGATLPRRFVHLSSDTTAVFWADEEATVLDLLTNFFEAPRAETVAALFESAYKGRAAAAVSNRFYCLILTGAQGRAIVRGMHTGTVEQVEANVRGYFRSIDIGSEQPLPLRPLMQSLVLQGKLENLAPGLVTDVFLAIVFGLRFPQTLLASAVGRCRAERKVTPYRAALLRAYLTRNHNMEVNVSLDNDNMRVGYRLGRLMAVLERIQARAQNNPHKTIVDRYYGAASTAGHGVSPAGGTGTTSPGKAHGWAAVLLPVATWRSNRRNSYSSTDAQLGGAGSVRTRLLPPTPGVLQEIRRYTGS